MDRSNFQSLTGCPPVAIIHKAALYVMIRIKCILSKTHEYTLPEYTPLCIYIIIIPIIATAILENHAALKVTPAAIIKHCNENNHGAHYKEQELNHQGQVHETKYIQYLNRIHTSTNMGQLMLVTWCVLLNAYHMVLTQTYHN